ncbi:hypothetical protein [Streptomyces sp. NBC_01235]|nr:hypothetical protein OG289_21660 [Streptomyces sp. NBC_01235]
MPTRRSDVCSRRVVGVQPRGSVTGTTASDGAEVLMWEMHAAIAMA